MRTSQQGSSEEQHQPGHAAGKTGTAARACAHAARRHGRLSSPAPLFTKHTASQGRPCWTRGRHRGCRACTSALRPAEEEDRAWHSGRREPHRGAGSFPPERPKVPRFSLKRGKREQTHRTPEQSREAGRRALSPGSVSQPLPAGALQAFQQAPSRDATGGGGRGDRKRPGGGGFAQGAQQGARSGTATKLAIQRPREFLSSELCCHRRDTGVHGDADTREQQLPCAERRRQLRH